MNCRFLVGPLVLIGLIAAPAAADYLLIRVNIDRVILPDAARLQQEIESSQAQLAQQLQTLDPTQGGAVPMNPGVPMSPMPKGPNARGAPQQPGPGEGELPMTDAAEVFDPKLPWVGAFVEYKINQVSPNVLAEVETRFGKAVLPLHPLLRGNIYFGEVKKEAFASYLGKRLKKTGKDKLRAEDLVHFADWALMHGLTKKETVTVKGKGAKAPPKDAKPPLDRVVEELAKLDPKHPMVKSFLRARSELQKPLSEAHPDYRLLLDEMQQEGYRAVHSPQGHYTILSNLPQAPATDAILKRRLAQLEDAFESFYLWFALQHDLPQPALPPARLVAILATTPQEFYSRHIAWGAPALAGDGFTPRRENVVMLSGRRLDDDYSAFAKAMDSTLQTLGVTREEVLTGSVLKDKNLAQNPAKAAGLVYVQPLTLLLRALEDESENAAASHEATRQLLVASGLLPRHVQVPEWIITGIASFFETPMGAVYGGVGLPSATNLIALKYYRNKQRLGTPEQVLYQLLTDRYFQTAQQSMAEWQENKDNAALADKAREDGEIARATAWAFVYHLAQNRKFGHLLRYGQELNRLPRDLDLDERTLQACFAKAFDELADPKDARRLEPVRLKRFADEWLGFMQGINMQEDIVEREYLLLREQREQRARAGKEAAPEPPQP